MSTYTISIIITSKAKDQFALENTLKSIQSQTFYYLKGKLDIIIHSTHIPNEALSKYKSYFESLLVLKQDQEAQPLGDYITYLSAGDLYTSNDFLDNQLMYMHLSRKEVLINSFEYQEKLFLITDSNPILDLPKSLFFHKKSILHFPSTTTDKICYTMLSKIRLAQINPICQPSLPYTHISRSGISKPLQSPPPDPTMYILIPYRDRAVQLEHFQKHMTRYLQDLQIKHRFIIIEQVDQDPFRKALLINIGIKYLDENEHYKNPTQLYFCMHDIDTIPTKFNNYYKPPSGIINHLYGYYDCLCGAFTFNLQDFIKMNGFSNSFEGWGGEDQDMYARALQSNIKVTTHYQYTRNDPPNIAKGFIEMDDPLSPAAVAARLGNKYFKQNLYLSLWDTYDIQTDGYNQLNIGNIRAHTTVTHDTDSSLHISVNTNAIVTLGIDGRRI